MAEKTVKVCDVYGTPHNVDHYRVDLVRVDPSTDEVQLVVCSAALDMCPRAARRMEKFIRRGSTPPGAAND